MSIRTATSVLLPEAETIYRDPLPTISSQPKKNDLTSQAELEHNFAAIKEQHAESQEHLILKEKQWRQALEVDFARQMLASLDDSAAGTRNHPLNAREENERQQTRKEDVEHYETVKAGNNAIKDILETIEERMALSSDDIFEGEPIAPLDWKPNHPLFDFGERLNSLIAQVNLHYFDTDEATST